MSKRRKKNRAVAKSTPTAELNQILRRPDLSILGNSVKNLPPTQWQSRMFFAGVADTDLRQQTADQFPATLRPDMDTHPVFVLQRLSAGNLLCPCTSKGRKHRQRYIAKGCCLEMTGRVMDRDSFLVEQFTFTIPFDHSFSRKLFFQGQVPAGALCGGQPGSGERR
jgi:hypothetical protein